MGFKARLILFLLLLRCAAAARTRAAVMSEGARSTEPKSPEIHCAMLGSGAPLSRHPTRSSLHQNTGTAKQETQQQAMCKQAMHTQVMHKRAAHKHALQKQGSLKHTALSQLAQHGIAIVIAGSLDHS